MPSASLRLKTSSGRRVPFANPGLGLVEHREAVDAAITRVLDSGVYILGPEVAGLELEFAAYLGVKYATGVASGTDALECSLRGLGIGAGDSVVTVSHTAVATV